MVLRVLTLGCRIMRISRFPWQETVTLLPSQSSRWLTSLAFRLTTQLWPVFQIVLKLILNPHFGLGISVVTAELLELLESAAQHDSAAGFFWCVFVLSEEIVIDNSVVFASFVMDDG